MPEIGVCLNPGPKIAELVFLVTDRKLAGSLGLGLIMLEAVDGKVGGIFYRNERFSAEQGVRTR